MRSRIECSWEDEASLRLDCDWPGKIRAQRTGIPGVGKGDVLPARLAVRRRSPVSRAELRPNAVLRRLPTGVGHAASSRRSKKELESPMRLPLPISHVEPRIARPASPDLRRNCRFELRKRERRGEKYGLGERPEAEEVGTLVVA